MISECSISTIIPTYNRARLLPRAIASALAASRERDEILVIDDGSTDETEHMVAPYLDRIRYMRISNGGAGRARNIGVKEARNPLIAFLDSDDEWMADKLELQRAVMHSLPEVLYCFTDFAVRHRSGEEEHRYLFNWHQDSRSWDHILGAERLFSNIARPPAGRSDLRVHVGDLYPSQMEALYVFTSTLMVRRDQAGSALRFAEDISIYEDWECYGRLAKGGQAAYLDCETAWQHGHEGVRLTDARALNRITARIKVLDRVWGSDREFLARHGTRYRAVVDEQRESLVKELIWTGRRQEARRELQSLARPPFIYFVLTSMPSWLAQFILRLRKRLRAPAA